MTNKERAERQRKIAELNRRLDKILGKPVKPAARKPTGKTNVRQDLESALMECRSALSSGDTVRYRKAKERLSEVAAILDKHPEQREELKHLEH